MIADRVAGAPISWGVCEVPGWGHQLDPQTVLGQMRALGLRATEFGPAGFLPDEPGKKAELLASCGLRAVGGFLPLLIHDAGHDPMPEVDAFLDDCLASGAGIVVLAAATGSAGYDAGTGLDDQQWTTLLGNLDRVVEHAHGRGVLAAIHPHAGTMVEDADDVDRVLAGSSAGLCVDTGHLLVGGVDPVALSARHPDRVAHVHLKDVDAAKAARVRSGALAYGDAVRDGLFRPLGQGDVDIVGMVRMLEVSGYRGWYVLEQDVMLSGPPVGAGPAADVRACLDHLRRIDDAEVAG